MQRERSGGLPATHESWLPKEHNLYRPRHSPRPHQPPRQGLQGAVLLWDPDVGIFSHRVSIQLA